MPQLRHPPQFKIAQLMAVIAVIAVIFAIFPPAPAILFSIGLFWIIFQHRTRLPRGSPGESFGCLSAMVGFFAGGASGFTRAGAQACGLAAFAAPLILSVIGATLGGLAGRVIAFAVYRKRHRAVDHRANSAPDQHALRRARVSQERDFVARLVIQAEKDCDAEVLAKLTAYKAKLEQELEQ